MEGLRECRGCVRTMLDPALFIAASANWRYTTVSAPRRLVHRVGNKMLRAALVMPTIFSQLRSIRSDLLVHNNTDPDPDRPSNAVYHWDRDSGLAGTI